jgi:hypothetical protein
MPERGRAGPAPPSASTSASTERLTPNHGHPPPSVPLPVPQDEVLLTDTEWILDARTVLGKCTVLTAAEYAHASTVPIYRRPATFRSNTQLYSSFLKSTFVVK